jgi:predicted peroxiredoxin
VVRPLLVKVTCGADDPERANQGFTVASLGVAAGAEVSLWLSGESVWTAVADRPDPFTLEHAASPRELVGIVRAGGTVTVCSQCATRRGIVEADLDQGARIAGAAVFVEEALRDGVQALVY